MQRDLKRPCISTPISKWKRKILDAIVFHINIIQIFLLRRARFVEIIPKVRSNIFNSSSVTLERGKKSSLTRHADAAEGSRVVETGAIVLTGMGFALVHVRFASRPRESLRAVASERAGRVHANTIVLARGSWNGEENIFFSNDRREETEQESIASEANGFA